MQGSKPNPEVEADRPSPFLPPSGPFGGGLQQHYARAIAQVAARLKGNPAVLGYELMNEPMPGVSLLKLDPWTFANTTLYAP